MVVVLAANLEAMLDRDILENISHAATGTYIVDPGAFALGREIGGTALGRGREGIKGLELRGNKKPMSLLPPLNWLPNTRGR